MEQSTKLDAELQPNFQIGQMVDDLVEITIDLCVKKHDKEYRFPYKIYNTYVDRIMNTILDIQQDIFIANGLRSEKREQLRQDAYTKCIYVLHLMRISNNKGWISDKQYERWTKLTVNLKYKIKNWK